MSNTSKNLGLIASIKTGPTPPSNKNLIWIDTSTNPPKKKVWYAANEVWLETAFVPSPANTLKRKIVLAPDTNVPNTVLIEVEDTFIKTTSGTTYLNIPAPSENLVGKEYEIVNLTTSTIYFNRPIRTAQTSSLIGEVGIGNKGEVGEVIGGIDSKEIQDLPNTNPNEIEQQLGKTSFRILCCYVYGSYRWVLIFKSSL